MKRRTFLATAAATSAALWLPSKARAATFGTFPQRARSLQLPEAQRVESVLEIYLYGGLSPWETLYYVDDYGKDARTFWYQYNEDVVGAGSPDSNEFALAACAASDGDRAPDSAPAFFANDALGNDVMTGPFAFALRARPDLVDRLRLVVQRHDLLPHEAAVPFALTGKKVGQPSMSSLGAHVQRYFTETLGPRRTPYSYVLASAAAIPSDNTAAFVATGTHPGSARPLRINVDNAARLQQLLVREGVTGQRALHDDLVAVYVERYRARLKHRGRGEPLRSPRFTELAQAANALRDVDAVRDTLTDDLFAPVLDDVCGSTSVQNLPAQSLKMAAHLLCSAEERARYVCVVDSGLTVASGGGGYDTHSENAVTTVRNFTNLMRALSAVVNAPGENDPQKIDLRKTLVLLNTEFGRTPAFQEGTFGRNHHPDGYVTGILGGPVPGRTILGAIDEDAQATTYATPAENRMAALLALGIWPYDNDSFVVADHANPTTEEDGAAAVLQNVLGVQL